MIKASYLLTGPELGEKKAYIDSIRTEIKNNYGDEIEEYTFYPYDSNMNDAIGAAQSLGMFSNFKIIFINRRTKFGRHFYNIFFFIFYFKRF